MPVFFAFSKKFIPFYLLKYGIPSALYGHPYSWTERDADWRVFLNTGINPWNNVKYGRRGEGGNNNDFGRRSDNDRGTSRRSER